MRRKKRTTPNVKQEIVAVRSHWDGASEWVSYRMGTCTIIVSHNEGGCWQLSIAHPRRLPTWDEVKRARYELLSHEIDMAMLLPRPEEYINVHEFCLQMIEVSADQHALCGEKLERKVPAAAEVES